MASTKEQEKGEINSLMKKFEVIIFYSVNVAS